MGVGFYVPLKEKAKGKVMLHPWKDSGFLVTTVGK